MGALQPKNFGSVAPDQSQTGVRFSAKAAIPLAASGPRNNVSDSSRIASNAASRGIDGTTQSIRLVSATARGAPARMPSHS